MRYEDASHTGAFQGSEPIANDDADTLTAGARAPATGNVITGEGTQYGAAGADQAAGAQVTAIAGKGGEDTSFSGGKLSVGGEFGRLSIDAEGNYTYQANKDAPENVRDRFTYTLADNQGNSDSAALIVEIGKTPVVIKADAQQIVPGPDGVVTLPPGVELSDVHVVGRNLVVDLPDGTQLIIIDGAVFVPQLVIDGVTVPATNVATLLIGQEPQPAAGETVLSGGGNFALPPPPLDPGVPLGDLIPPTEYDYIPPEPEEVFDILDRDPEIFVQPDGQPASVAAVDEVDERGLPTRNGGEPEGTGEGADGNASNDSDPSEATAGLIIYNSPDGVDSITINGQPVFLGQVINGAYGTLEITSVADGQIGYAYTLDDNIDHSDGAPDQDDFSVVLTDNDGDQASATLTINILDDVPTAVNDTDSIPAGQDGPATGNVLTDAAPGDAGDSDDGADTVGADDAELTNVTGFGTSTPGEGGWVVQGQYGVLTISADGSYSYVRNEGTPGGVTDVFNYTLTDGDGDVDTATLTITIENAEPTLPNPALVLLDDDVIPGENGNVPDGPNDDNPDTVGDNVVPGQLAGTGGDGPLTYNFTGVNTLPDGFSIGAGSDADTLLIVQTQNGGPVTVMTIQLDQSDGSFTVTQNNPIVHPTQDNTANDDTENNLDFSIGVEVEDVDGDVEPGAITINVDDDTPVVTVELDREGSVTVDESGPTGASTIEFTGDEGDDGDVGGSGPIGRAVGSTAVVEASALFGADGALAGSGLTYTLQLGGTDTPLTLTDGSAIQLQLIDGVVVGMVTEGDHAGEAAFAIAVNPTTGIATVELYLSLDHPDATNPNDSLPLGPDTVSVVVSATDADGDTAESAPVNISGLFNFLDDGPTADGDANSAGAVTVDESGPTGASTIEFTGDEGNDGDVDGSGPIGRAVGSASVVANAAAAFGADGPSGDDLSYALALGSADTPLTLTDGSAIQLQLIDGVIVGMVTEGDHDGEAAFAIAINPATGVATVELYLSLDHPTNPNPNDSLPLGPNTISVVVTATDGDGDSDDSDPIDISGLFNFLDDGPDANDDVDTIVGGVGPATGNVITGEELAGDDNTTDGTADDAGADGGAAVVGVAAGDTDDTLIDSGTVGVEIEGAHGKLTLNADGSYSYLRNADSPGGVEDVFTYTLTDGDGDTVTATLTIGIEDNFPEAGNVNAQLDDDALAGGNAGGTDDDPNGVGTGGNLPGSGGDGTHTFSVLLTGEPAGFDYVSGGAGIVLIQQGGETKLTVTVNADGSYSVVQNNPIDHPTPGVSEENVQFTVNYRVTDQDGDFDDGTISIDVDDDTPTVNVSLSTQGEPVLTTQDAETDGVPTAEDTAQSTGNFSGMFGLTASLGADGGAAPALGFALAVTNSVSGLASHGVAINLYLIGGKVVGSTAGDAGSVNAGNTVFDIGVTSPGGVVTLTQYSQVDHPIAADPTPTETPFDEHFISLANGKVTLTASATATDGDGDQATDQEVIDLGGNIRFADDGPIATNDVIAQPTEDQPVTFGVFGNDQFGADGVDTDNNPTVNVTFTQPPAGQGTVSYNAATGEFTFTPAPGQQGSTQFTYTIKDFDGDTSTATVTINLKPDSTPAAVDGVARVDDDGLVPFGNDDNATGDLDANATPPEVVAINPSEAVFHGQLAATAGGDTIVKYDFASMDGDPGTVGTDNVVYSWDNATSTLTAETVGGTRPGTDLFKVVVNQATGEYNLTLLTNILHENEVANQENDATASLTFTATDSDTDTDTGTIVVTFDDDMPVVTSVTDPLEIDNDATPSGTGNFAFSIGADQNADFDDITVSNFTISVNGVPIAPADMTFTAGAETETTASYEFTFDYDTGDGGTTTAEGTLVFNKADGTYTVELTNGPIEAFSIASVQGGQDPVFYDLGPVDNGIAVVEIADDFFIQFTGQEDVTGSAGTFGHDETFGGGSQSEVKISSTNIGVFGNSVQDSDVLDYNFYETDPGAALGPPTTSAGTAFIQVAQFNPNGGEDFIVVLKLADPNTPGTFITRTVVVETGDVLTTAPAGYPTLGNGGGLIIIEPSDYIGMAGVPDNYEIVGMQLRSSTEGLGSEAGEIYNFDGDLGQADSSTTSFSASTNDNDVFKIFDIGVVRSSPEDQSATIEFDVTIEDSDGDQVVVEDVTVQIGDPVAPAQLPFSTLAAEDQQTQKSAANSNTLTMAAAVAAAGMSESAAAMPPADDSSLDQPADDSSSSSQMVGTFVAADDGEANSSAVAGTTEPEAEQAPASSAGHGRGNANGHDAKLDADSGHQAAAEESSHSAANDQGPAVQSAHANPVAPAVAMISAEALQAAGLGGEGKGSSVEQVIADALGHSSAPTLDAVLQGLPGGGNGELAAIANLASPAAGHVPGWDMGAQSGFAMSHDVMFKMGAEMLHHDAVQPAVNG